MKHSIEALAAAGASALVGVMTTDIRSPVTTQFVRLLGQEDPPQMELIAGLLDASRATFANLSGPDVARSQRQEELAWRRQLAHLLEENPNAAGELRALVDLADALLAAAPPEGPVHKNLVHFDRARRAVQRRGAQV